MDWKQFVAELVRALAWPVSVVLIVVVLRPYIARMLGQGLRHLKVGPNGLELDFDTVDNLRSAIETEVAESTPATEPNRAPLDHGDGSPDLVTIEASPTASFLTQYIELERTIRDVAMKAAFGPGDPLGTVAQKARDQGLITEQDFEAFQYLRRLRNDLVHGMDADLSAAQAVPLIDLTRTLIVSIRRSLEA